MGKMSARFLAVNELIWYFSHCVRACVWLKSSSAMKIHSESFRNQTDDPKVFPVISQISGVIDQ